jgi:hypothetical protein
MSLSLNVPILMAESFYTVYKFTKYQCHCPLHDPSPTVRRSLKKFDLKCGAHSGAALKRVNTIINPYYNHLLPNFLICEDKTGADGK